jgi:MFS superfamily sulfate permease-like transporter
MIPFNQLKDFVAPALTITALGAVESLLCGAVASNMTGIRLQANQELVAQGLGNLIIPFFGGVPATAAVARSSVGIKSGGRRASSASCTRWDCWAPCLSWGRSCQKSPWPLSPAC